MKILGLGGWSGAGKTTLLSKLIPELIRRGVTVSTMKHAHHGFDVDQPGKDSYVHRQAGATEVLVASATHARASASVTRRCCANAARSMRLTISAAATNERSTRLAT